MGYAKKGKEHAETLEVESSLNPEEEVPIAQCKGEMKAAPKAPKHARGRGRPISTQ
jgi:hypothetical protein